MTWRPGHSPPSTRARELPWGVLNAPQKASFPGLGTSEGLREGGDGSPASRREGDKPAPRVTQPVTLETEQHSLCPAVRVRQRTALPVPAARVRQRTTADTEQTTARGTGTVGPDERKYKGRALQGPRFRPPGAPASAAWMSTGPKTFPFISTSSHILRPRKGQGDPESYGLS